MNEPLEIFKGTVDDFLSHCSKLDVDAIEKNIEQNNMNCLVEEISENMDISPEEAQQIIEDIKLDIVQKEIDHLLKEGLIEISSYNDKGEPLYSTTKKGSDALDAFNEAKDSNSALDAFNEEKEKPKKRKKKN